MTAELGINGTHDEEKVPHDHADGDEEIEDGEEDGVPEAGAGGASAVHSGVQGGLTKVCVNYRRGKEEKEKEKAQEEDCCKGRAADRASSRRLVKTVPRRDLSRGRAAGVQGRVSFFLHVCMV